MLEVDALDAAIRSLLPNGWASHWGAEHHDWMRARDRAAKAITAYMAALPSGAEPVAPEGWQLVPREPTPEMLSAVWSLRASNGGSGTRACYDALLAQAPKPDHLGGRLICEALGFDPTNHHNAAKCPYCSPRELRMKPATFAGLKRHAEDALDALAAYAHNNEALEDASGESAKAMVAATWNRVKAEQALTAVRDMTFKSAQALSSLGEQS